MVSPRQDSKTFTQSEFFTTRWSLVIAADGQDDSTSVKALAELCQLYWCPVREWIESSELTPDDALAIVAQVCELLQYAHDEGVVRCDIKRKNILLDGKGRMKIADFGSVRSLLSSHFFQPKALMSPKRAMDGLSLAILRTVPPNTSTPGL